MKSLFLIGAFVIAVIAAAATGTAAPVEPLGTEVRQLILSIAPDWSSRQGTLQRFERRADGQWLKVGEVVPVLYGKNGLAWGRGVRDGNEPGLRDFGSLRCRSRDYASLAITREDDQLGDNASRPWTSSDRPNGNDS